MVQSYLERFGRQPAFPTEAHRAAAEAVVDYFAPDFRVQAVLLACSCARGQACAQSCVDMIVLVDPTVLPQFQRKERARFDDWLTHDPAVQALARQVPWSGIDLDIISGEFTPEGHRHTTGADMYEVEIGNTLAWVRPLLLRGPRFEQLQAQYLPYYDEALRQTRLAMVKHYAANNLDHIVPYAERGLYEQAFKRLYHAFEEYLQALFIQRRIYPIAYDKWLREQVVEVLGEPVLYDELLSLIALSSLTVRRLRDRARRLRALLEKIGD
jgi:hypothetical protein